MASCETCGREIKNYGNEHGGIRCANNCRSELLKPKRGRPATERGAYNPNPARQFGRVSDEDWETIKAACDLAGMSLVSWGLPTLLKKARRELSKGRKPGANTE